MNWAGLGRAAGSQVRGLHPRLQGAWGWREQMGKKRSRGAMKCDKNLRKPGAGKGSTPAGLHRHTEMVTAVSDHHRPLASHTAQPSVHRSVISDSGGTVICVTVGRLISLHLSHLFLSPEHPGEAFPVSGKMVTLAEVTACTSVERSLLHFWPLAVETCSPWGQEGSRAGSHELTSRFQQCVLGSAPELHPWPRLT